MIQLKSIINELYYDKIKNQLNLPNSPTTYKVGSATRTWFLVPGGSTKLISILTGTPLKTISNLSSFGFNFNGNAYVNFKPMGKSYLGTGSG